jgi:regulator of protease activity HflC (stomatin/prohibitin superfamily)
MRRLGALITGGIVLAVVVIFASVVGAKLEYVRPGYTGVSVRKCGGGGVKQEPILSGYYWRELFCEEVVEYPVSLQTLVLTRSPHEGSSNDDSITVTSSEGLPINVDVSLSFTLDPGRVPAIYVKFRNDLEHIKFMFMRQTVREGLQEVFARYTAEQLYSTKRQEARVEVQKFLGERLGPEGFVVAQFTLNETRVPEQVVMAINGKVAMTQEAQKAEQQVRKTRAEADQAVAAAEGQARSKRALADAEAYYNATVAKSLTPEYVQYRALEKWDGQLPQMMGSGTVPFINIKPRGEK